MRRAHPDPILCVTLSVIAVVFRRRSGFSLCPRPVDSQLIARGAVACSTSILLLRVCPAAQSVDGSGCVHCLDGFGGCLRCVAWTLPVATTGAVLSALSLGTLGVAARLSIAAAGLTPSMPSSDHRADDGLTSEMPRAVTAHHTLSALVIGSAGAAAVGATLVASACVHDGRIWPKGAVFAAVVGLVMVLRARTHIDMSRRAALVVGGMAAIAAGDALVVVSAPEHANWVCLLVTGVGLSMLGGVFGATVNPLARRTVEVLEYLALRLCRSRVGSADFTG